MRISSFISVFALAAAIAVPEGAFAAAPKNPGDKVRDGSVLAGVSPETNAPMYTSLADAPRKQRYTWESAVEYCAKSRELGNRDWVLPTLAETAVVHQNRDKGALKDSFMTESAAPALYWTSTERKGSETYAAWAFRFNKDENNATWAFKDGDASVRCIRRAPADKTAKAKP